MALKTPMSCARFSRYPNSLNRGGRGRDQGKKHGGGSEKRGQGPVGESLLPLPLAMEAGAPDVQVDHEMVILQAILVC